MHVRTLPLLSVEALLEPCDLRQILPLCFCLCQQCMLIIELVLPIDLDLPNLISVRIIPKRNRIDKKLLSFRKLLILQLLAVFNSRPQHLADARAVARRLALKLLRILP